MDRAKLDNVIALVNSQIHPAGYDCIEADWIGNERILRLFIDSLGEGPGVTLDGCVKASRLLAELPKLDDMIPTHYTLEVSSPGVERPLRLQQHFLSHVGQLVQVKLLEKVGDRRQGSGKILQVEAGPEADGALITLATEQGVWSFPLASVQRASLVYDWGDG